MNILCFTGWQQPADALKNIVPNAQHAAYADYENTADFFASLPAKTDLAIGWSLGGQMLVRAIAGGHLLAKHVILLGAAFQFVASDNYPQGMPQAMWDSVLENYRNDPQGMLQHFCGIISAGDTHAIQITRTLAASVDVWKNGLFWLEELGRFSCASLDFSAFPPTTLIHGEQDKVAYPTQAQLFKERIPHATLQYWQGCAHAPHLHDAAALQQLVALHV